MKTVDEVIRSTEDFEEKLKFSNQQLAIDAHEQNIIKLSDIVKDFFLSSNAIFK